MLLIITLLACPQDKAPTPPDTQPLDRTPEPPSDAWLAEVPQEYLDGVAPSEHGGYTMRLDPDRADAVTAYGDCGAILQACLGERAGDFATCVHTVALCQTDTPWEEGPCCPAACEARFDALVAGGASAFDAYVTTFALEPSCFPGLEEGP